MGTRDILIQQLANGPVVLRELIASLPEERLEHRWSGDIWSVQEHVQHLALTQIMLYKRIQLFLKEDIPEIVPFIPDKNAEPPALKPIPELLDVYESWRGKQVGLLTKADNVIWSKEAVHPEYTHYNFDIAVRHILTHDGFHFYRIEELGLLKEENVKPL
jgi:hypothetical protein